MKLLAFSDVHLDAVTAGKPRRSEVVEFLHKVSLLALQHEADLVVFAGDAHDPGSLLDPLYAAEIIWALSAFVKPVVAIPGNHDVVDTSELFDGQPVTTLTPLRAAARFFPRYQNVRVLDRPQLVEVSDEWAVLGLPYVSRAHSRVSEQWVDHAFEKARRWGGRLIVVGHLVVPGAAMGSESVEMAKGQDQLFPFARVAELEPELVLNGHYHGRQVVSVEGIEVVIPGSPLRFTFGEAAEVSKGVIVMEL